MSIEEQKIIWRNRLLSRRAKRKIHLKDISIISMNCIGGIIYHDCGEKFLSPTVNLYFLPDDFLKFVNNLDIYLNEPIKVVMGTKFPVGVIGNIKVFFQHYTSLEEAKEKWEERKKRINKDKIIVIMVERDGFSDEHYREFKKIKYPKILYAKSKKYESDDTVYFKQFERLNQLPDIIPGRYIYKNSTIINKINSLA